MPAPDLRNNPNYQNSLAQMKGGPQIAPAGGAGPLPVGGPNYQRNPTPWLQTTGTTATPGVTAAPGGFDATKMNVGTTSNDLKPLVNSQVPAPSTTPTAPGTFSASSNMINAQITPNPSQRLQTAQGYTSSAAANLANWTPGSYQNINPYNAGATENALNQGNAQMQSLSTQGYRPVAGTNLGNARAQTDAASSLVGQNSAATSGLAGMGQTGGFGYAGDTQQVRALGLGQLQKVLSGTPDRATLANNAFQRLLGESNPQFEAELRATNAKNAAMGRRGSGLATQDLGTVQQRREEALMRERGRLSDDAAAQSLADVRSQLDAAQGFGSSLANQDTAAGSLNLGYQNSNNAERGAAFDRTRALGRDAFDQRMSLADAETRYGQIGRNDALTERGAMNEAERYGNELTATRAGANRQFGMDLYGIGRDSYGDQVRERDNAQAFDQQTLNNRRNVFGDLGGYEQGLANNERADRNELRGERGYQYDLSRDAQGDRIAQDRAQESDYGLGFDRARQMAELGYGQDPSGAYLNAAGQYGQEAQQGLGAGADLLAQWGMRRGRQQSGGVPRPDLLDTFRAPNFEI